MRQCIYVLVVMVLGLTCGDLLGEFPVHSGEGYISSPVTGGNVVVWMDYRNGDWDIYGYDLTTHTEFPISTASSHETAPSIDSDIVVWSDNRNGNYDIYGYNLITYSEFPICVQGSNQSRPVVSDNVVVWMDQRNGDWDIYGYNLNTHTEFSICVAPEDQTYPDIDANTVVWQDFRSGDGFDIYGYNSSSQTELSICTVPGNQYYPKVSGDIVVWQDTPTGDIYGYNLLGEYEFPICIADGLQGLPDINGSIVVWQDNRNGGVNWDIYGYDLSTLHEFTISIADEDQSRPSISENYIVWQDIRNEPLSIYAYDLADRAECYFATEAMEGVPYIDSTVLAAGTDLSSCSYKDTPDVWYWFTPQTTSSYIVSLCGSNFNTTLAIFDDCDGIEIACNDDFCGLESRLELLAIAGRTYLIRISGTEFGGERGNYILTITKQDLECTDRPQSDLSGDCRVDLLDFCILASEWLDSGLSY